MTVVYIDSLFLLNLIVDYLLLLGAARLSGAVLCRPRMALGAVFGAAYACAVFLPGLGFLTRPAVELSVAVAMALIAYGGGQRLLRSFLAFLALSCALGGGVLALSLLGARGVGLERGVLSPHVDLGVLLLASAGCYAAASFVFRRSAGHGTRELVEAVLTLEGRQVTVTALLDTGNTLTDPATGQGVMVVEGEKAAPLLDHPLGEAQLRDPVGTLARMGESRRFRLLPYQAVGVECGLLLAVRLDKAKVGEREYRGVLAALSPTRLSDGGAYSALVGAMES
ncbi:sigma-E processing peptidase SpoIIGA [Intestinimonas timonensis]|uniref:sigma-E processing peptidase SpoIIGA n=1 Tax=Intestinimonas timonensis TaxID=1689270 RepID=UPI003A9229FC